MILVIIEIFCFNWLKKDKDEDIYGQTFCDLHTLLHSFYGFPGACYKVTILICHVEGWTFVGLKDCIISHFKTNKVQDINPNFICVTYTHLIYPNP